MRNKTALRNQALHRLLTHARYEVLPTASTEEKVSDVVPMDVAITVTASSTKGLEATLPTAEAFAKLGYVVVPHLAARMIHDYHELDEIRERLPNAGITSVFVPGGDVDPVGDYPDSFSLLEDLHRSTARSRTSASPATPSRIRRSPTTSPCRRCGTSDATPPTWSATSPSTPARSGTGSSGCGPEASRCRCCSEYRDLSTGPSCSPWPPRSAWVSPPAS